jgi:hypothetical protein
MTIHRMLQNTPMGPEEVERLVLAYEQTLRELGLTKRDNQAQMIAKKVVEVGQTGLRDPAQISWLAINELGL